MQIPILIEPVVGIGFRSRGGEPCALHAEGTTREEVLVQLQEQLQSRFRAGAEVITLTLTATSAISSQVSTERNGPADSEQTVADFMEPVQFVWTEAAFEAREALQNYSEQSHAGYIIWEK